MREREKEDLSGVSYGRFWLEYIRAQKDPYGFGIWCDQHEAGQGVPWATPGDLRYAYLVVKFKGEEPIRLRPKKIASLLSKRPKDEICRWFKNYEGEKISPEEISQDAERLSRMEDCYLLQKDFEGKLTLISLPEE